MNDFETRARAAGRAIRDTVDDTAAVSVTPHKSRGPLRALAIAAIVTLIAVVGTTLIVNNRADAPADVPSFCAQVDASTSQPVSTATSANGETQTDAIPGALDYLRNAPPEIRDVAMRILDAQTHNRAGDDSDQTRLLNWVETRCYPDAAQPGAAPEQRRYAPVPAPEWFETCMVWNVPSIAESYVGRYGQIAILGDTNMADPYEHPMIGLAFSSEESFRDDNTQRPAPIPGHPDAVLSAITGPFGAALTNAGQVVSWRDGERNIGVFGRGYSEARTEELLSLAAAVRTDADGPHLDPADLPTGYQTIFDGPLLASSPPFTVSQAPNATYSVTANHGVTVLSGSVEDAATFEATRFFGTGLRPTAVKDSPALAGPLWVTDPTKIDVPLTVIWRAPDGVVLSILSYPRSGVTPTLAELAALARSTRLLDRAEWEALIGSAHGCAFTSAADRGESNSGSGSQRSGASSTTTPVGGP